MKTVSMADEPKTKQPRTVDVILGSVQASVQVSLLDKTDKSVIMKGEVFGLNFGAYHGVNPEKADEHKEARERAVDAIESAVATYYQEINQ